MDRFIRELEAGEIHQRGQYQFELKSDFFLSSQRKNIYTQEFYLFIPNTLQINEDSYPQSLFYRDQTNLIRYKTPSFTLKELSNNPLSPLVELQKIPRLPSDEKKLEVIVDKLKLLGNTIRSALREEIYFLINSLLKNESIFPRLEQMCAELTELWETFLSLQKKWISLLEKKEGRKQLLYVNEFISNTIHYYFIGLLEKLRESASLDREKSDSLICAMLVQEGQRRKIFLQEPTLKGKDTIHNEFILYRSRLLDNFVLDTLLLNTVRSSLDTRFRNLIGAISAGIAMLFFLIFFAWQGKLFLINSLSFILLTVLLYVIKDRLKEGFKTLSYRQFSKWFYDYSTEIRSPDNRIYLGKLKEAVSFIQEKRIPENIKRIRNREFHAILETVHRPEQVIYYKRQLILFGNSLRTDPQKNALNILFRFSIEDFLRKADDPFHDYVDLNLETFQLSKTKLPKVYHLNIIMRGTFSEKGLWKEELKKFRLILDHNGIKRVEHLK